MNPEKPSSFLGLDIHLAAHLPKYPFSSLLSYFYHRVRHPEVFKTLVH